MPIIFLLQIVPSFPSPFFLSTLSIWTKYIPKIQNYQNIKQTFSKAHTSCIRKSKVIFWSPCDGDDGDEGYDDDVGDGDPLLANVKVRGAYLAWKATPARGVPGSDGSFSALPSLTEPALSNRTRCSTSM